MLSLNSHYKTLKDHYRNFEELKNVTPENIQNALQTAEFLKEFIRRESMFSKNETLEDLPSENIPYFLVPYYQACIVLKITDRERRKTNLEFAEAYIDEFLTYLDDYRLTPEKFKEKRMNPVAPTRDEKIIAYKAKKEIEETIKFLESQNSDDCRDLYLKELELAAIQSLEHLDFINLEKQMLTMASMPRPEPQPQPYRPPQILKIDENNIHMMPRIINGSQDLAMVREELKERVFTQRNAPSMTIEEYGEWAYKEMKEREAKAKEEQAKIPEYNSDDEEQVEAKRKKDSSWDDWKDEHEKGAGNKGGR